MEERIWLRTRYLNTGSRRSSDPSLYRCVYKYIPRRRIIYAKRSMSTGRKIPMYVKLNYIRTPSLTERSDGG